MAELEDMVEEHVIRAWDYLANNSDDIDCVLRQFALHSGVAISLEDKNDIIELLSEAIEATREGQVDLLPSLYELVKTAKALFEQGGTQQQIQQWLQDTNRFFK
jgi:hypothetical protein